MIWPKIELQSVAEVVGGATPSRSNESYWNGDICWITPSDLPAIGAGVSLIDNSKDKISKSGLEKTATRLLPKGTVLFSSRASIGKIAISQCSLTTNQGFINFIPKAIIHSRFLAYALFYHTGRIEKLAGSTTFKEIPRTKLRSYEIEFPAISEQHKIVEILDQADELLRKRKEANEKATKILPALFYKMFGDPATNSMGWKEYLLGDSKIAEINPRPNKKEISSDLEVSFVPMADVDEKYGRIVRKQLRLYSKVSKGFTCFSDNDVLFAKITPCMQNGKAAIARNMMNGTGFGSTEFHVIRPKELSTPEWIFTLVRLPFFRNLAKASFTGSVGQQRVPTNFIKEFKVYCPPMNLQKKFANSFWEVLAIINKSVDAAIIAEGLFKNLLYNAFSGKLTAGYRKHNKAILEKELRVQLDAIKKNHDVKPTKSKNKRKT